MRQKTISVTPTQSIVVIQGAYESFCVQADSPTEYRLAEVSTFIGCLTLQTTLASDPPIDDWLKFLSLVAQWQQERGALSSITEAALCPAYQAIIGMGATAVPFILAQLESEGDEPDQWFWALRAISGANPVKDQDRGNYARMAASWLQWAKTDGYAW